MRRSVITVVALLLAASLGCTTNEKDDAHSVDLEPQKTQDLYRGLSGIWEVTLPGGGATMTLCEAQPTVDTASRTMMSSSETEPRAVMLESEIEPTGGAGGCGTAPRDGFSVAANWEGSWTTPDGSYRIAAEFSTSDEPYPEAYPIRFTVSPIGTATPPARDDLSYGWFRLDGSLRAIAPPAPDSPESQGFRFDEEHVNRVLRRVGDAECPVVKKLAVDARSDAARFTP